MGFEEIPHTADWAVRVWADDLPGLLCESARAMNALSGIVLAPHPRIEKIVELEAEDDEARLVALLSELIYRQELEHLAFDEFDISLQNTRMSVRMHGAPITAYDKAIKAVTWHNLKIQKSDRGMQVEIVFDV
jgi:SHS2 domain-containing protein